MKLFLPLAPAWAMALWLTFTSEQVWSETKPNLWGETGVLGWYFLGFVVATSVLYLGAPFFGRRLAVTTSSSTMIPMGESKAQRDFGTSVVRFFSLLGLYLLLACVWLSSG